MRWLLDLVYALAAVLTAPIWIFRMVRTGKFRTDWRGRFGVLETLPLKRRLRVLLHAVSVGEVNAIRPLVDRLAADARQLEIVICTTTDTGYSRAISLWHDRLKVVRYPFDFSFSVGRFLRAVDPDLVVLVELEVWPGFTAACARRRTPVCVVNGRLTERSFRRYGRVLWMMRPSFRRLAFAAVQNETYARRFNAMGVAAEKIFVTGTMKWDAAQIADAVPGADQLATDLGVNRSQPLVVAGSTAPGEHELLLRALPAGTQLMCAPRKPEWFDQAAQALPGCVRRSQTKSLAHGAANSRTHLYLLDTIGELRQAYAIADVVVVGRSFGDLHGSDMIEPIALGKPTIVGPAVSDFQDAMDALLAAGGVVQATAEELPKALEQLLMQPQRRYELARNGRDAIRAHQGATERTAQLIMSMADR